MHLVQSYFETGIIHTVRCCRKRLFGSRTIRFFQVSLISIGWTSHLARVGPTYPVRL